LTEASVAIDGSKFKAVNNRDKNFTRTKMDRRMAQIEESVARYLQQLDNRRPARAVGGAQDQGESPEGEDCQAEGGDAAPSCHRGSDARRTGPADITDRS